MMKFAVSALAFGSLLASAPAIAADFISLHTLSVSNTGTAGVLRAGSPWGPGSTPSDLTAPVDGTLQPEGTQWNNGSFWWDQDSSVNATPVYWTVVLDGTYDFTQFLVQADDNDSYLLEYWDGAAWQTAFNVPAVYTYGLITRESGPVSTITTDRFRFSATGGDNYYGFSGLQATAVPEPSSWLMMIAGFGAIGLGLRRSRRSVAIA